MPLVTWSDKFSVGVKSVDEQHSVLFKCINNLHEAMMKGQARQIVGDLLRTLLTYTEKHFAAEEAMLEKVSYPGLFQHRILHRSLTRQVQDYIDQQAKGDITLGSQLSRFLSDWLTTHIQKTDMEYGRWLKDQGRPVQ